MKKFLKIVLFIVLAVFLLLVATVLYFRFSRTVDRIAQQQRLEQLQMASQPGISIPDTLLSDKLKLNQIRYLATHNSYHHEAGALKLAVLDLVEPGEAEKLKYSHLDFYRQLELGVRSFELDLRYYRSGSFENIHIPLVDNRGHSPSLKLSLDEMRLWSNRHPQHVPVIVIMEVKEDWRFLDPGIKKWTAKALLTVDALIIEVLGERLITPAELIGDATTIQESVLKNGWPELGESRGKFIFVFHESESTIFNKDYFEHEDRVSFYMDNPDSSEAAFILRNDPEAEDIRELIDQGFIISTRADVDTIRSNALKLSAIASGSQIVSTDFPMGYALSGDYSLGWDELLDRWIY